MKPDGWTASGMMEARRLLEQLLPMVDATMTCRRDRLPSGIPAKYWHKQKTDISKRTKVARFFQPVVAVKEFDATDDHNRYRRVNVSFQSTSSCNISTVNTLSNCALTVHKREREVSSTPRGYGASK